MTLSINVHDIEVKFKTIKKRIKYALEELDPTCEAAEMLDELLDLMDNGTNVKDSAVPNRKAGDLSIVKDLQCIKGLLDYVEAFKIPNTKAFKESPITTKENNYV